VDFSTRNEASSVRDTFRTSSPYPLAPRSYCWISWFFSYDAGLGYLMQWQQVTDGVLNAHHPILHTLFLKYTILFGKSLFGTFNAVVLLSVMFQAIIFAICIKCLLDFGMPRFYFLFMIVFWA
jgi:hypothetical protein